MICPRCGKNFLITLGGNYHQVYCSRRCQQSACVSRYHKRYPDRTGYRKKKKKETIEAKNYLASFWGRKWRYVLGVKR